jgi:osmoprotectant transport system ATP-binding protein
MIALDRVVKTYDGRNVVEDVSLTVEEGAFCALVGSSGSGKSTLLRLINRLIPLTRGSIRIAGRDIGTVAPEELRRGIGYAIQSVGLFPHWTIERNIGAVPRLLGWPEPRIASRVVELLTLLRLDPESAKRYPHQLSGGQQQRVGVARALAADPPILLMDEPFGALDPIVRQELQNELRRIHRATGKTILMVTHDMDEALGLADRIAILRHGRLLQSGTPAEILAAPADDFVRDFLGGAAIGLKRLATRRVGAAMRPGNGGDAASIAAEATLAEALALMLDRRLDRLDVADGVGGIIGSIGLADLIR